MSKLRCSLQIDLTLLIRIRQGKRFISFPAAKRKSKTPGQEIKASGDGYLIFTSQMVVPVGDEAFLFGQDAPPHLNS